MTANQVFAAIPDYTPGNNSLVTLELIGMVALTGQWWLGTRRPRKDDVLVAPGAHEPRSLEALLDHLLARPELRERMERAAREHVRRECALPATVARLLAFLRQVADEREALARALHAVRVPEGGLAEYLVDEARWSAHELGLQTLPDGVAEALLELVPPAGAAA